MSDLLTMLREHDLPPLWHYTCDHGRAGIDVDRSMFGCVVRPLRDLAGRDDLPELTRWAWFTDMARPDRDALGLTSHTLNCDRLAHRYRVLSGQIYPWTTVRRLANRAERQALESAPGARPRHWFVARQPVVVEYAPEETRCP